MLNNPMVIDQLTIHKEDLNKIVRMTQEEYDILTTKDPYTTYIIKHAYDSRIYLGDILITNNKVGRMYLLGPSNKYNEYIIYLNERDDYHNHLIEISRFETPKKAIDAINLYNRVGYHNNLALNIYNILVSYISDNITINEMIIGIICSFGYSNDTRLQEVIQVAVSYDANNNRKDLPLLLIEELVTLKNNPNHLFKFYSDLYDLATIYNYFTDKRYTDPSEHLNLSEIISKIYDIFVKIM